MDKNRGWRIVQNIPEISIPFKYTFNGQERKVVQMAFPTSFGKYKYIRWKGNNCAISEEDGTKIYFIHKNAREVIMNQLFAYKIFFGVEARTLIINNKVEKE